MRVDEWRMLIARHRAHQEPLTASGMRALLREVEALVDRMEAVEEWSLTHAEGDGLRAVLWPRKEKR